MFLHVVCSRATASEAQGAKITSERKKTSEVENCGRATLKKDCGFIQEEVDVKEQL